MPPLVYLEAAYFAYLVPLLCFHRAQTRLPSLTYWEVLTLMNLLIWTWILISTPLLSKFLINRIVREARTTRKVNNPQNLKSQSQWRTKLQTMTSILAHLLKIASWWPNRFYASMTWRPLWVVGTRKSYMTTLSIASFSLKWLRTHQSSTATAPPATTHRSWRKLSKASVRPQSTWCPASASSIIFQPQAMPKERV